MAISGVADADVETIAKVLGASRRGNVTSIAFLLNNYAYQNPSVATADGGSHALNLTFTNLKGMWTVDWQDGTITRGTGGSTSHTYAGAGSKTVFITAYGYAVTKTQSIA